MASPSQILVLVTGGSGFVGSYCIIDLLNAGYNVRTTIRSISKSSALRDVLKKSGRIEEASLNRLSFAGADLTKDDGWEQAVSGCTYVLHVASPFPPGTPKHEDDLIIPARDGALRVLRAAKAAGVRRVVMTSSFAAVSYGHPQQAAPFTEDSWTNTAGSDVSPYAKSKTLAERAAWDFIESPEGEGLELSVINPAAIFGPVLSADTSASILLIQRLLNGELPGCPNLVFGIVERPGCCFAALAGHDKPCCCWRAFHRHLSEVNDRAGDRHHAKGEVTELGDEDANEGHSESFA
ncbi:hypothetical protein PLIIFM63780_003162 [Purpureocillium lilacinum]|nr:hypothetical protein PLIIFM63780_003162 [Purpureocillium lilacinum]